MMISRIAAMCSSALLLVSLAACSSDDSSSSSASSGSLASLSGKFGVAVVPQFSNCEGAVYFPQEVWVVVPVGSVLNVVPVPVPGTSPSPVMVPGDADASAPPQDAEASSDASPSQSPAPQPSPQDTSSQQEATPVAFSAAVDSTLHFQASLQSASTTTGGCLQRTTTLMDVQFTSDGKLGGTRKVFNEYTGGSDCPADCRVVFGLAGQKLPE